ncbi:probable G-protein coupled receptor Mth-like 10 isoform X2 [Scaptodrosophila lebanonensis]|uniref:Probable G-protein coupled receptor Mth-like 10 isoform X2 n=1 Tax=Drosophila lebanonensis TaxID=7225 RepID=A0A6J2TJG1_DROLE|nr:probable G-protein coupled receptor Mth-like 10 isoform X2 [Scaptodrosophila lebanonensis]XP_030375273.1 probable G-protein coupled receptor Mth-like 10 isoform X2 [Scaptodrosophila lebanonensis]XP_030375274.1 probable G-protein coupled receptor Mth-like 10 isoform X2 [Scaptodrosophila lebanonensis]
MHMAAHAKSGPLYCGVTLIGVLCLVAFRLLPGTPFGVYALPEERNYHQRDGIHTPCTFFDTVNVTGDMRFDNGSYLHDGVIIPRHLVGLYDYIYKDLVERVEVTPHMRGCICKLKSCLNICCPWGSVYDSGSGECRNGTQHLWPEPFLNVTFSNYSLQSVNIFKQYVVQQFRPCVEMFSLQPELNAYDSWLLFENGTMLREDDMTYISKNEFCLVPTTVNDTDIYYSINPANCDVMSEYGTVKIINAYTMLFSIPFMLLTIAVYLLIPELRNQHGKSLVCYLLGLSVGYSTLCCVLLIKHLNPEGMSCKVFGYTAYYFFMSAFLWLNVISFDLWHNFRGTRGVNRFQEKKRFLFYSLYSWGLALVFLVFTWYAQEKTDWPAELKPGIGAGIYCWLDMHNWSAMIYFFGPILIIIVANTVMFVMTAIKIHTVQREMARIIAREDSTKNLRTEKDKFGLFLRLFLIMGVTWSSEIVSYFVGADKKLSKVFYISDLCNAMQGFLIFMLFVLKKKVKHLITNRLLKQKPPGSSQTNSTNSTNSEINTNPDKFKLKAAQYGAKPNGRH